MNRRRPAPRGEVGEDLAENSRTCIENGGAKRGFPGFQIRLLGLSNAIQELSDLAILLDRDRRRFFSSGAPRSISPSCSVISSNCLHNATKC